MKTHINWKWALIPFLVVLLSAVTVGCGKKSKKSAGTPPGGTVVPGCPSCVGTTNKLASGYGFLNGAFEKVQLGIHLFSSQAVPTPVTGGTVPQYSGTAQVAGYLSVEGGMAPDCPIRPGIHQLRTATPNGTFNRNNTFDITNLNFEAVHGDGTVVRLVLEYGEFYDQTTIIGQDNHPYDNGIWGQIRVVSVGNFNCGYYGPIVWFIPKTY